MIEILKIEYLAGVYIKRLFEVSNNFDWKKLNPLIDEIERAKLKNNNIFLCGNGGSAGNANHLANDFIYGVAKQSGQGLKINSLASNSAVLTCLANDIGYKYIFSEQIKVLGNDGDILIVLSGSGNSENIVEAVVEAKKKRMKTVGILGFDGGYVKDHLDIALHFEINDMQISEDLQLIVGHLLMKYFYENKLFIK